MTPSTPTPPRPAVRGRVALGGDQRRGGCRDRGLGDATVEVASLMDFEPPRRWGLLLTKALLIHLPPESRPDVYDKLVAASSRYIIVCEYYNPTPVEVSYRGHEHSLFKRDFAGEILDAHHELRLVDYGFTYHRDPHHPLDDSTRFLMEILS
ncbi:MAG: hypothetical protein HHJ11_01140 [Phycicoccus sp.]|nr:hypothetical protein [Phycicoccus sp.]NMM32552.1 hypothetical protein [Phycicoccus sp.]